MSLERLAKLTEKELQYLADDYRARDANEVHDLLRRLGDQSAHELALRRTAEPVQWIVDLEAQRRAIQIQVAGDARWIAAEDAGLYRDALGTVPTAGLPDSFLIPVEQALEKLLRRYARHRGPFPTRDPAARYNLRPVQVDPVLGALEAAGVLMRGEIRPDGAELEWCDAEVLRRLKRRNLARLRDQVAAVDAPTLALFLPRWQCLNDRREGLEHLREVIGQLQALPLPWSLWTSVVLPSRVAGFRNDMLDMLAASGAVVWVGRGATGARDGRIAMFLREQVRDLLTVDNDYDAPSGLHRTILDVLQTNGASFLIEIDDALKQASPTHTAKERDAALWDLVWAGQITNDTFGPLRDLGSSPRRRRPSSQFLAGGRWSLVRSTAPVEPSPTSRTVARAKLLLDRYGIVNRKCAQWEEIPGGFAPLYKVYREMEEQGQVRRGHFVDGLEGAQFAYAGAVDRLRASRRHAEERDWMVTIDDINALAAMDPANPYGALLPWPQTVDPKQPKPRRVAGAWILLARGRPVLYLGPRGRTLLRVNMADAAAAKSCTDRRVRNVMARGKHLFIELDNHTRSGSDLGRDQTECHRAPRARAS